MDISFQLYTSREVPSQAQFLSTLADLGYTQVEGFGGVYGDVKAFRAAMDAAGISMPSGHFGLAELEEDFDGCVAKANTLGMRYIFAPYLSENERPTDTAGYKALAARLAALRAQAADAGFGFGWHNHDFELEPLADGSVPLDILLTEAPDMTWEADLAWVIRGGADAAAWVDRFGSQIASVHVKDIAPAGENLDQDGWCDVGAGVVDWADLVTRAKAKAPNALLVMEHDKPADAAAFAKASIAALKSFAGGAA